MFFEAMRLYRTVDWKSNPMDSSHFENNFKRTIRWPTPRANMNEPSTQQVWGAGAGAILDGWSRSEKLLNGGARAWNFGSGSTEIVREVSDL